MKTMKTAKPPPAEAPSSSRRSQPVRQTRTNPPRTNLGLKRLAARDSQAGANTAEQPINIYPGVTHFADAITALPKELVRHFTLLKEVDAKIFAPEEALFQLIDTALEAPPPPPEPAQQPSNDAPSSSTAHASTPQSAQAASDGIVANGTTTTRASTDGSAGQGVFDSSNLLRRQLFRQTAYKINEMLVSLEEKNHVISTANDALHKQLTRIDEIWPHLQGEFSEEAKWGSDSHWAYPENRAARALNHQAEKTRREGAANLSAAAQVIAEEAAARSDARKQAVAAKKSQKNQHHDSEHDDHDAKGKDGPAKKTQTSSKRKTAAAAAAAAATESPASVGLGISGQASTANNTPVPKRRKVEKPPNGATPTDRAVNSTVSNAKESKAKPSTSPRSTPAPDQPAPKKRKALPTSNGQAKKRAGPGASSSVASSPVVSNFPDNSKPPRASPAPSVRPASSRARQNSTASNADSARQRPPSAASNKPNGNVPAPIEIPTNNNSKPANDSAKTQMEPPSATAKTNPSRPQSERAPTPSSATIANAQKKEGSAKPTEQSEVRKEPTPSVAPTPTPTPQVTTTKSGRASKPSTPAIGSFPDTTQANNNSNNGRARPSRNSEAPNLPKRSHKKGASAAHAAAVQKALAQQQKADEDTSSMQDDDDTEDPNEPRYCYCNRISFGEMVGCDGDKCKIEWFHLECVGLKAAPPGNMRWYCDDCKKQVTAAGKKVNGR